MQALIEKITHEGRLLGDNILKVDSFLNHQVDPALMLEIGQQLYERLNTSEKPITKVLTAEASGIAPAMTTALAGNCKMVFARKSISSTMVDTYFHADAISRTRGNDVTFYVNTNFLNADDHVLIIEDFLATGASISALIAIADQAGASIAGVGSVIEKESENGRTIVQQHLGSNIPIASLARLTTSHKKTIDVSGGLTTFTEASAS